MYWQWKSIKGKERKDNRDAAGVLITNYMTFAVVADGSSKGENGSKFVCEWIKALIDALDVENEVTVEIVIKHMKNVLMSIRKKFLSERACYCALLIRDDLEQAWAINCGDCRLGRRNRDSIEWLTPVHTLANPLSHDFTELDIHNPRRHIVTRCLKSRRFANPDTTEIDYSPNAYWILGTDGDWIKDFGKQGDNSIVDDDASRLTLSTELTQSSRESDCSNWYSRE